MIDHDSTVSEVKVYLRENWEKGVDCPCCGRLVKLYKRTLNAGIVINLLKLYNLDKDKAGQWVHVYELMKQDNNLNMEYSKLGWWGLLEKNSTAEHPDTKSSGLWRITAKGKLFAEGRIDLPLKVHIYDNKVVGFSEDRVNVNGALGLKFSYAELMGHEFVDNTRPVNPAVQEELF